MLRKDYNWNSCVFYEGPSVLDGKPIVGILSNLIAPSKNTKTGAYVAQAYIMRADISPLTAAYTDNGDYSVCGDCPLKPSNQNICYVNLAKAPSNIWKAYAANRYLTLKDYPLDAVGRRLLRFGAYGDPTAIPFTAWQPLVAKFPQHTGYTHQWQTCDRIWQKYLMASCETTEQVEEARSQGWRTTRVINPSDGLLDGELLCRNQARSGVALKDYLRVAEVSSVESTEKEAQDAIALKPNCEDCRLCDGNMGKSKTDIAFVVHGSRKKHFVPRSAIAN
jgi:hypothetical protein